MKKTIYSHQDKPLIQHLQEVANLSVKIISENKITLNIDLAIIKDLAYIAGAVHDIGKCTKNFQTYLLSGGKTIIRPKHHAMISAFVARNIAQNYLANTTLPDFEKQLLPYLLFVSVKRHHGNLNNFGDELEQTKFDDLDKQIHNFYEEEGKTILNTLLLENNLSINWDSFKAYIISKVFEEELPDFYEYDFKEAFHLFDFSQQSSYFYLYQLLYSTLLYADKSDVILGIDKVKETNLNLSAIKNYRAKNNFNAPTSEINQQKNKAYFESIDNLSKAFSPSQHLYSITLPTGLGKTITSLAIGMKMKQLLADYQQDAKIVIAIPFTSIIDQNYEVFNEIFDTPSSNILLKHHHLSDPIYKIKEDDVLVDKEADKSKFLIETWQAEVVVTTFVQLFETLFTNDKSKLLKLPNLTNAIIILDEIQQINYEYWPLIRQLFKTLGSQFNCYFILMSATQPLIFDPATEIKELIPNYRQYFKLGFLNRTKIINKTQTTISLEDFTQEVIDYHFEHPKKDILVILNTKDITKECFKEVRTVIKKEQANLYFLTTLISPFERKEIINKIKKEKSTLPNIIISTQLIEAGVDISVNTVFRNIAPIDSIIQAAGRANRYNENEEMSSLYLYNVDELTRTTNMIYGAALIKKTKNVLKEISVIEEKNYLQIIEAYFKEVKIQADNFKSKELQYLNKLQFKNIGEFKLIEES